MVAVPAATKLITPLATVATDPLEVDHVAAAVTSLAPEGVNTA